MINRRLVDIFQLQNLNISLKTYIVELSSTNILVVTCVFVIFQYKNIAIHVFIIPTKSEKNSGWNNK